MAIAALRTPTWFASGGDVGVNDQGNLSELLE
jgi:hypothetical protein